MKSSIIEWLARAWAGMRALAPYVALLLLPGGSLLTVVLFLSRLGRVPHSDPGHWRPSKESHQNAIREAPEQLVSRQSRPILGISGHLGRQSQ